MLNLQKVNKMNSRERGNLEQARINEECYGYCTGGKEFPIVTFFSNPFAFYFKYLCGVMNLMNVLLESKNSYRSR
jgi:hypothetical protein